MYFSDSETLLSVRSVVGVGRLPEGGKRQLFAPRLRRPGDAKPPTRPADILLLCREKSQAV